MRDTLDSVIGARLRYFRLSQGLSQAMLGRALHLSCQQVQKYEKGVNRLSASLLVTVSGILDIPPTAFLEGLGSVRKDGAVVRPLLRADTLKLAVAFEAIPDRRLRQRVLDLVQSMAAVDAVAAAAPTAPSIDHPYPATAAS